MSTNMQIASQPSVDPAWPREVGMILSAMEVADVHEERRDLQRLARWERERMGRDSRSPDRADTLHA